jgi:hypothetical protein
MQTCPYCAESIPEFITTCPLCDGDLGLGMQTCPYCAESIPESITTCPLCDSDVRLPVLQAIVADTPRLPAASPIAAFCWSCGVPWHEVLAVCMSCGAPGSIIKPSLSDFIGRQFTVRRRLTQVRGIVVDESDDAVSLLLPGEEKAYRKDRLGTPAATSGKPTWSDAWRLVEAGAATSKQGSDQWDRRLLSDRALRLANRSEPSKRAFAFEALNHGQPEWLDRLSISGSERLWLLATFWARRGDYKRALQHIEELPRGRYPGKIPLILAGWSLVASQPAAVKASLMTHVLPFVGQEPLADLASALLMPPGDPEMWRRGSRALLSVGTGAPSLGRDEQTARLARILEDVVDALGNEGALAEAQWFDGGPVLGALSNVLAALSAARQGGKFEGKVDASLLSQLPLSAVDDLVDAGLVGASDLQRARLDGERGKYLRARLTPETLSDEDVAALGFEEERARRAFVHRDRPALEALGQSPGAKKFRALDHLRQGRGDTILSDPSVIAESDRKVAIDLAKCLQDSSLAAATEALIADRSTWESLALLASAEADLLKLVKREPRFEGFAGWLMLSRTLGFLYEWNWGGAIEQAKSCLRIAQREATRDEALNLLACAHWQMGHQAEAVRALQQALEGQYTEALQANIGVVAATLEPRVAAAHLGRLAQEAPTLALREAAAMRALALWNATPEPWETDDKGEAVLPAELRAALRALTVEGISEDSFRPFLRTLAHWDAAWLTSQDRLKGTPHQDSQATQIYVALARGYDEFVRALAKSLKQTPDADWLCDERDTLVEMALRALSEDPPTIGAALFGIELLKARVPLEPEREIPLTALSIAAVAANVDPEQGEPKEEFLRMLMAAEGRLASVPQERQTAFREVLNFAFVRMATAYGAARSRQFNEALQAYRAIASRLAGTTRWSVNREAVRRATDPLLEFCSDTKHLFKRILEHLPAGELADALTQFLSEVSGLASAVQRLPR